MRDHVENIFENCKMNLRVAFVAASLAVTFDAAGHPQDLAHVHVGGGLAHPPHVMTMQVWYRDIVYDQSADDPHQTSLDIYVAGPAAPSNAPVMVFVHGGAFAVGDKASSKDLDPKPEYFTSKLGYVFVSINYRLLPQGQYPRNVQDVANALAWLHDNIADLGGDPEQLFLMGHSAGAELVAQVATDESFLHNAGKTLSVLKGVIANDGGYGVPTANPNLRRLAAVYGSKWREASAVSHVGPGKHIPPFLLLHVAGGTDFGVNSERQAIGFADALHSASVRVERRALADVEHFGANERIGEPGDQTTLAVERFLDSITGRTVPAQWVPAQLPR